jgi:hypothetical protein
MIQIIPMSPVPLPNNNFTKEKKKLINMEGLIIRY